MLKPSEIRIGNLVTVNNPEHWPGLKDKPLEVIGINQCKPVEGRENTDYSIQLLDRKNYNQTYSQFICFIEPIRLVHDLFVGLNFSKNKVTVGLGIGGQLFDYYEHKESIFIIYESRFGYCKESVIRNTLNPTNRFYNFLHQLQNVYADFVGEELVLQD